MTETAGATEKAGSLEKQKLRLKGRLMSASEIERTLVRLAHEIVEKNGGRGESGAGRDQASSGYRSRSGWRL